ncbi:UNVERIFIED_CONTAM: hypothetical protein PYX00_005509 [Menopon gallinae]|uniref:Fringe-like glycosyltransferase domain-containing protein n=1 Tax=Menopon gallinae TaxID=328185 RepID=A0AAW2HTB4_9NEOP
MRIFILLVFLTFLGFKTSNAIISERTKEIHHKNLVFVILSQADEHHEKNAKMLEYFLKAQTNNNSKVFLTHRDLKHVGDWTVIPLLERLWDMLNGNFTWLIFCTDQTGVDVNNLIDTLQPHTKNETFIGRGLSDAEPTIIHHFTSIPNFQYPLFAAGFGINRNLLERIVNSLDMSKIIKKTDFSIDASHELALFLKNNLDDVVLTDSPRFCLNYAPGCATYVTKMNLCKGIDRKAIFFAVKTCEKFHHSRVPIVQITWGKKCFNIAYFSDVSDLKIPTVEIMIPNVDYGHCRKSEVILEILMRNLVENNTLQWVVLADDDTILSVRRIQKLLGCYNPREPVILGERYGYKVLDNYGYNYITGGGGVVLSREAVMRLSGGNCRCPRETTPDDMFLLGICARKMNIGLVHIPLFHQARPNDYNSDYLKIGNPISFHKHWMTDPVQIYKDWFEEDDAIEDEDIHSEL